MKKIKEQRAYLGQHKLTKVVWKSLYQREADAESERVIRAYLYEQVSV